MLRAIDGLVPYHVHHRPTQFFKLSYLGGVKTRSPVFYSGVIFLRNDEGRVFGINVEGPCTFQNPLSDGSNHGYTGEIVQMERYTEQIASNVFVTKQGIATSEPRRLWLIDVVQIVFD